jgi:hypothetical protein
VRCPASHAEEELGCGGKEPEARSYAAAVTLLLAGGAGSI